MTWRAAWAAMLPAWVLLAAPKPAPCPPAWHPLLGEYGAGTEVLLVFERGGHLEALKKGQREAEALTPVSGDVFRYRRERLVFRRGADGAAMELRYGSVVLPRRPLDSYRITPQRPIEELRREALAAAPPREQGERRKPELVEVSTLDAGIRLDIRYAGTNNFLGTPLYSEARAFLERPAAEALVRAHRKLWSRGYGLLIHDAYRPWYVTKMFWEATPPDKRIFVADPKEGSRHNRGCAVDLTPYDRANGRAVEMTSAYDEMSDRAYPDYRGGTSLERWHRDLLRDAMEAEGFQVYEYEWWHFDYKDWDRYPILNVPFARISPAR